MSGGNLEHVIVSRAGMRSLIQREGFLRELDLQLLVKDSPELLGPLGLDLKFLPIGWEVPLGPFALDALFLDSEGVLTLVETKLRANSESRREVVGQVLEYGAYVDAWSVEDVERISRAFFASQHAPDDLRGLSLQEAVSIRFGWATDEDGSAQVGELLAKTAEKLSRGHLRIVCGVDERIEGLERLVNYLSAHSDLQVVLLQVNRFRVSDELTVLVPSLHGDVDGLGQSRGRPSTSNRLTLDEIVDSFPDEVERETVAALIHAARNAGASFEPGPSGTSIRVRCSLRPAVTVGWIWAPNRTTWMKTRDITLGHGLDSPDTPRPLFEALEQYYNALVQDGIGQDASSKGVHARWLAPAEAHQQLPLLISRLQEVIRNVASL